MGGGEIRTVPQGSALENSGSDSGALAGQGASTVRPGSASPPRTLELVARPSSSDLGAGSRSVAPSVTALASSLHDSHACQESACHHQDKFLPEATWDADHWASKAGLLFCIHI